MSFRIGTVLAVCLVLASAVGAQEDPSGIEPAPRPAVLVADDLFIAQDRELVAKGNVEVIQGSIRLTAREIRYDRVTGALTIQGPIRLQDGDDVVILASGADLDPSLRVGLLTGARMVIDQQLQLAAASVQRVNERYDQLYKTAVTSCDVCDDGRPPLWQLRARRVIHDKEERQLYFDQAQFLIRNIPVLYVPRLRLPDPTVERATGFLLPSWRNDSRLGTGVKIPYFIALKPDRDILLTPYVSSKTRTLEFRYRQAFETGRFVVEGAVSRDDVQPDKTRGYAFGSGQFNLPNDYKLDFDFELTSDAAYLQQYDYSDKDRLESAITLSRTRRDEFISGGLIGYQSLRDGEDNSTLPSIVADAFYDRRFFPAFTGGEFRINANAHSHVRYSNVDIDGRDVARFNVDAKWLRSWFLPGGARTDATAGIAADFFNIEEDSTFDRYSSDLLPFATLALRYPMAKTESSGATQYLEPIAQVAWSGGQRPDVPNEESDRTEFDGGNLLSLSRFPAPDRRERDLVGAYGLNWSRYNPAGLETSLTLGHVIRADSDDEFTESSGLRGKSSNYLVAGQVKSLGGLELTGRTIFDSKFAFTKTEVRGAFKNDRGQLSGTYIWLIEDVDEDRLAPFSEIYFDGDYRVHRNWTTSANIRYDLEENQPSRASLGLTYFNECVTVDLSVRRRYTSNSNVDPSTSIGITVGLRGFTTPKGSETNSRTCG